LYLGYWSRICNNRSPLRSQVYSDSTRVLLPSLHLWTSPDC
jgi:hypothetical protein